MSYDSRTTTISITEKSDFILDSGQFFIDMLKKQASSPDAPEKVRKDWKALENWLGCKGRPFGSEDAEKISLGWRAYMAIGLAPSQKLQPLFDLCHKQYKESGKDCVTSKPPTEVMDVFDRLLATETEIRQKKKIDMDEERKKFEPLLREFKSTNGKSWWRRKSKSFRLWVFGSFAWAIIAILFIRIFNPFHMAWRYLDAEDFMRILIVMTIPLVIGILVHIYKKFVE